MQNQTDSCVTIISSHSDTVYDLATHNSLLLTAVFPVDPGLASFIGAKDNRSGSDWRQLELYDVQSSSHTITTNKPSPNILTVRMPFLPPNQQAPHNSHPNI